jgi:long-chain fatty acid transport protein
MITKTRQASVVLAVATLLAAQAASATNGYFTHGLGVKNKGMAGAGTASPQVRKKHYRLRATQRQP